MKPKLEYFNEVKTGKIISNNGDFFVMPYRGFDIIWDYLTIGGRGVPSTYLTRCRVAFKQKQAFKLQIKDRTLINKFNEMLLKEPFLLEDDTFDQKFFVKTNLHDTASRLLRHQKFKSNYPKRRHMTFKIDNEVMNIHVEPNEAVLSFEVPSTIVEKSFFKRVVDLVEYNIDALIDMEVIEEYPGETQLLVKE